MSTDGADANFLVDHVDSTEAVKTEALEALLAGSVDRIEPGARILLLPAVKRPRLRWFCLKLCFCVIKVWVIISRRYRRLSVLILKRRLQGVLFRILALKHHG